MARRGSAAGRAVAHDGNRARPGLASRRAGAGGGGRSLDQQRAPDHAGPARPGRARRVLDLRLNQLQERDPAVAGLVRALREGWIHDRGRARPGVLLGEVVRQRRRRHEEAGGAVSGRPGQRPCDLEALEHLGVADDDPGRPEGRRTLSAHRRGRLRPDRSDDPALAGGEGVDTGVLSPSARFSALALLAIVAPAAIVAVLGYVSIRQWGASSELLYREQARDMATMAADKVETTLRRTEDAFLDRAQAVLHSGAPPAGALDDLLAGTPLIRRLYLIGPRGELVYPRAWRDGDQEIVGPLVSAGAARRLAREGKREVVANPHVCLALLTQRGGEPVVAAFLRDPDILRREILETTLGALESSTIIAVLDHEGRTVYSRVPIGDAQRVLSVGFREALPDWRLTVYQAPGASPRQAVRRQVMLFTGALGVLVAVIAAGIVATWRLMRRETEMARLKSDFVANVSHDLKTPLSVIRMFGETLEMGRVRDERQRQEYYRVIARESERLSRLIENVLDFARIEGGRRASALAPTAVEPVIRDALEAFSYPLAQQGFKVDVRVAPDLPEVPLDAEAVGQALANLIDNAIKYSAERKSLSVEARVLEGELAVSVADEGIGIQREEQARIFDKFYRVGRSDTQSRRGSGVGLALVRHVAEAHGGRVTVESRPCEGSRFTLWFPLGHDPADRAEPPRGTPVSNWRMKRWIGAVAVALVLWPLPGRSQPLVPLVVGWETMFSIDWSVGEERGRRVVQGYVVNQGGEAAARMRLLVEAIEDGRVVGQRVSWLSETLTPGTRAYFAIPAPAQSPTYRVTVFDYEIRRGGV